MPGDRLVSVKPSLLQDAVERGGELVPLRIRQVLAKPDDKLARPRPRLPVIPGDAEDVRGEACLKFVGANACYLVVRGAGAADANARDRDGQPQDRRTSNWDSSVTC